MSASTNNIGTQTNLSLAIGGTVAANFETRNDEDWVHVRLEAGNTYLFVLNGAAGGGGTLTGSGTAIFAQLALYDPSWQPVLGAVATRGGLGGAPALPFTATTSGTYYLQARGFELGTYTLAATLEAPDDFSAATNTSGRLDPGSTLAGMIGLPGDRDWIKVKLQGGELYGFDLQSSVADMLSVNLFDSRGMPVQAPTVAGTQLSIVPSKDGDYYAEVKAGTGVTGAYSLTYARATDDFSANVATIGTLTPASNYSGRIDLPNDRDWFKINLDASAAYSFTATTDSGTASAVNLSVCYRDPASGTIYTVPYGPWPFVPGYSGDYFLEVGGAVTGAYQVRAAVLADDYGNSQVDAVALTVGGQASGRLDYFGDTDWFVLHAQAGNYYSLELSGASTIAGVPGLMPVLEPTTVVGSAVSGYQIATKFKADTTGDYLIRIATPAYIDNGGPTAYTLKSTVVVADDVGNSIAAAGSLRLDQAFNAVLEVSADIDMFKVNLQAGTSYFLRSGGELGAFDVDGHPYLNLSSVKGPSEATHYLSSDGKGLFGITPAVSGDYFFAASAYRVGSYTLIASTAPDDFGAAPATAGRLEIGHSANGVLTGVGGDRDWFALDLAAGASYWFSATPGADASPLPEPVLKVLDAQGSVLAQYTATLLDGAKGLPYAAAVSGTYFLEVAGGGYRYGSYVVSGSIADGDDIGNTRGTASPLAIGSNIFGRLETSADTDMFKLNLNAGTTYLLTVNGILSGGGTIPLYGNATLLSADGTPAYPYFTGGGVVKPAVSGDYYLNVYGGFWGGDRYSVSSAVGTTDDFADNTATLGRLITGGAVSGRFEYANDIDYLKVSLHADQTYRFDLKLDSGGITTPSQDSVYLRIQDRVGHELAFVRVESDLAHLDFTAYDDGDVFIVAALHNGSAGSYTLSASTVSSDTLAPEIVQMQPANGSAELAATGSIQIKFSETIDRGLGQITLSDADGKAVEVFNLANSKALSFNGSSMTINPEHPLFPGASYGLTLPAASLIDAAGNKFAGGGPYTFSTAAAKATGSAGDDLLSLANLGAPVAGGAGLDTLVFNGDPAQVKIGRQGMDFVMSGADNEAQASLLSGVERILFTGSEHGLALDIDGAGGMAYRLYQSAFNRSPDQTGLGFWIGVMDKGTSFHDVAQGFVDSNEFQLLYGAQSSNTDFIGRLYQNVLHRTGEAAGMAFWMQAMQNGAAAADVLAAFGESAENQDALTAVIGNGFAYIPF